MTSGSTTSGNSNASSVRLSAAIPHANPMSAAFRKRGDRQYA